MELNLFDRGERDFNKALAGCIFKVEGDVFRLESYRTGRLSGLVLSGTSWTPHEYTWEENDYPELDITFPEMGYVNYKGGVLYAERTAARQWRIGYNSDTVTVHDDHRTERQLAGIVVRPGTVENGEFIKRLYNRKFFSFSEAKEELSQGRRISAAINKHIAISQSCFSSYFVIFYKRLAVGFVAGGKAFLLKDASYVSAVCPFDVEVVNETQ